MRTFLRLGSVALLSLAGCTWNQSFLHLPSFGKAPTPTRMVMTCSEIPLESDGKPVHQGMLCRVYFFAGDGAYPVPANGALSFKMIDPVKGGPGRTPDGIYTVSAEEMPLHLRRDIVGDSYVFWLPYEPEMKTKVSLEASFTPHHQTQPVLGLVAVELNPVAAKEGLAKIPPKPNARIMGMSARTVPPVTTTASASTSIILQR